MKPLPRCANRQATSALRQREHVVERDQRVGPPVGIDGERGYGLALGRPGHGLGLGVDLRLAGDDGIGGDVEDGQVLGLDDRPVVDLAQVLEDQRRADRR